MMREMGRPYDLGEEIKKRRIKKADVKAEMVEFFVETVEIANIGTNLGVDNLTGNALGLNSGIGKVNTLDLNKFHSVRETAEYARVYDRGLGKADEFVRKDKERTEKKIKEIRERLKVRGTGKKKKI